MVVKSEVGNESADGTYRSEADGLSHFPGLAYLRFLKQYPLTLVF